MTLDGQTAAIATVEASAVRPVTGRDMSHAIKTASAGWSITPRRSVVICRHVNEAEHNPSRNVYAAAQNRRLGR